MHRHHPAALLLLLAAACTAPSLLAPTAGAIGFDAPAAGWRAGSTNGSGKIATWELRADATAISPPNVAALTATNGVEEDRFNVYWTDGVRAGDGRLSVCVRADSGELDQGGGPMWRVQDAENYYVCRFNPLESNYRVYVVKGGVRRQLASAIVTATTASWHRLDVAYRGDAITCWFDGQRLLDASDTAIRSPGGVGLWTKADACTSFDDLVVTPADR